jgi:hypothetical protein
LPAVWVVPSFELFPQDPESLGYAPESLHEHCTRGDCDGSQRSLDRVKPKRTILLNLRLATQPIETRIDHPDD